MTTSAIASLLLSLTTLLGGLSAQLSGLQILPRGQVAQVVSGSKQIVQFSDFTFIGGFAAPTTVNGAGTRYTSQEAGIAFRMVSGEKRLLVTNGGGLYEIKVPADSQLSQTIPGQTAQVVKDWGSTTNGISGLFGQMRGIAYDPATSRIYRVSGDVYDAPPGMDMKYPTLWSFKLNDSTGTLTDPQGPWGMTNHSYKQTMGGVLMIPDWFANAYLNGKKLAVGLGGAYSTLSSGPASMGPALTAVSLPEGAPAKSKLSDTPLVGYPFGSSSWGSPDRARRDPTYDVTPSQIASTLQPNGGWFDGGIWDVQNGLGAWTWNDMIHSNAVWIDTPTKHGVLFAPLMSSGETFYYASDLHCAQLNHYWYMYDPADFAAVASGAKAESQIQAKWRQQIQYPFLRYPINPRESQINHADPGDPDWTCGGSSIYYTTSGMTFDPVEKRLYIQKSHGNIQHLAAGGTFYDDPVFMVYQLNDSGTTTSSPTPVDAILSSWSVWVDTSSWSACVSGTQTKTQQRTRTVLSPATNGGTTGSLVETQTVSQSCTTTATTTPICPTISPVTCSSGTPTAVYDVNQCITGYQCPVIQPATTTTPTSRLSVNMNIKTTANVNVRSTGGGALLGTQPLGSTGKIIGGPTFSNSTIWWSVDYTNAPDGWSGEDFLVQYTPPVCPTLTPPACTGVTPIYDSNQCVTGYQCPVQPPATTTTAVKFVTGDLIKTTAKINVRSSAGGRRLGSQNRGAYGTIVGGPTIYQGYTWWKVDYTNIPDGWSIQDYLIKR